MILGCTYTHDKELSDFIESGGIPNIAAKMLPPSFGFGDSHKKILNITS